MDLGISDRVKPLLDDVKAFVEEYVRPNEKVYVEQVESGGRWCETAVMEEMKDKAREKGLWNFFLPDSERGGGLNNVDYGHIAEVLGRYPLASEAMNCSAPDTGNMEVIERYCTEDQKKEWLEPLLEGKIRSAFCMTEPYVASSDATNIQLEARLDGDEWVLNGEKWWSSGIGDPRCKILIVMCVTEPDAPRHSRQSQILVPRDAPGIEVLKMQHVFGYDDAPHGHGHVRFTNVRVPKENIILGSGRGFEIAQGRLGPGRIHHCMRSIGVAERALELMCRRGMSKEAFGKRIADLGGNYDKIADARIQIEMARLLTLKAAWMMDTVGNKVARSEIAQIKVAVPNIALQVIDDAIQFHGGAGVSQVFPLAKMYASQRTLRLADGPDEVHRRTIARMELGKYPGVDPAVPEDHAYGNPLGLGKTA
ncbi:MAG TPA: acyl-CoA dehydrogenase family protein [Pseudomonadales bacterium]|nr:acyl-CoA dehydrogenase family protein [Pseudomonadales bacterium]